MKTRLLKTITLGVALVASTSVFAQVHSMPSNVRNYVAITGYNGTTPVTVSSTVKEDFSFVLDFPDPSASVLSAEKIHVAVGLNNTPSLDKTGERWGEADFNTNVKFSADLHDWLSNGYAFGNHTAPVTVIDGSKIEKFNYSITSATNQIIGTPDSYDNAKAAWYIITNNMTTGTNTTGDSFLGIKKGSYIQMGNEKLVCDEDINFLSGKYTNEEQYQLFIDKTTIKPLTGLENKDTYKAVIFIPATSTLVIGNSTATLLKDATITIDYSDRSISDPLEKILSGIKDELENTHLHHSQQCVETFFHSLNTLIGLVDLAGNVPVTVEFTPADLTVYNGSTVTPNMDEYEFQVVRATNPNAMAVLNSGYISDKTNVLVKQDDGTYTCDNFVLTDLTTVDDATSTDWVAPFDFKAVSGSYKRTGLPNGYSSFCLPFAVTSEMLAGSDILTYAAYDGNENTTLTSGDSQEAGVPSMAYTTGTDWNITFNNTQIKKDITNGNNVAYGTYTETSDYANTYFGVNTTINKFAPLADKLYPFRACLELPAAPGIKQISITRVATSINGVQTATEGKTIYSVSGAKLNKISQPGLYIVNGKKTYVK